MPRVIKINFSPISLPMLNTRSESETPRLLPSAHLSSHLLKDYHVNLKIHSRISTSTRFSPPTVPHTLAFPHHLIAISTSSSPLPPSLIESLIDINAFIVCRSKRSLHCSHSSFCKSRYVSQNPSFKFWSRFRCSTPDFFKARHNSHFALIMPTNFLTATPVTLFPDQLPNPHFQVSNPFEIPRMNHIQRMNQSMKLSKERQGSPSLALAQHHHTNTNTPPCTLHHNHTTRIITPPHSSVPNHHSATTVPHHAWTTMTSWSPLLVRENKVSKNYDSHVSLPPFSNTSASTLWSPSHVNGVWMDASHIANSLNMGASTSLSILPVNESCVPKYHGSLFPMPPLPITSASTSWTLLHVDGVWICVPHIDIFFSSLITTASTSLSPLPVNKEWVPKYRGSLVPMPPLPVTSALTSWRLLHFNGVWICVPHIDIFFSYLFMSASTSLSPLPVKKDWVPKYRSSLVPMPPLPITSASTSWRLLHVDVVWICVPHVDIFFPFLFTNTSTSHHEHPHAHNHITNTPTTPAESPNPISGDPNIEPNGDNNNSTEPPFIFLPHHPNTTKHHHPILSKTTLQITTHNTAKNMHHIQATILHHFNKGTDILCLQEIPFSITLDNSLGLTTFDNYAPDKTNTYDFTRHAKRCAARKFLTSYLGFCQVRRDSNSHYCPQASRSLLPQNPSH